MAAIFAQTLIPWEVSLLGDIDDQGNTTGILNGDSFMFATAPICGVLPQLVVTATSDCFFSSGTITCGPDSVPVWTLTSGTLPFGVRLDPASGVYSVSSSILLIRGSGTNEFTVTMTDICGNEITETYYTISNPTPAPADTSCCWELGALFSITSNCAYQGTYGLQRTADGVTTTSDAVNTTVINTASGQTYFLSFYAKGSNSADGEMSLGLKFFDSNGAFISFLGVPTTGSPTSWTQFLGNITAPANAVTARPAVRATNHLTGTWCVDQVVANLTGGYWILSGIKHYYDSYTLYR